MRAFCVRQAEAAEREAETRREAARAKARAEAQEAVRVSGLLCASPAAPCVSHRGWVSTFALQHRRAMVVKLFCSTAKTCDLKATITAAQASGFTVALRFPEVESVALPPALLSAPESTLLDRQGGTLAHNCVALDVTFGLLTPFQGPFAVQFFFSLREPVRGVPYL